MQNKIAQRLHRNGRPLGGGKAQLRRARFPHSAAWYLDEHPGVYVGQEADCRGFLEGVRWVMRTEGQWRELLAV